MLTLIRRALTHPLSVGLDIDSPETTRVHRQIIATKPFLKRIYRHWYEMLREWLPQDSRAVIELGSGAGFFEEFVPGVITSEVCPCPGVRVVMDAQQLPFDDASLDGIAMINVMHHIPDVRRLFREAARCLRPGGRLVAIEPWVSTWSRVIYTKLHHEPFEPENPQWGLMQGGRLSAANDALPWIVFERDRIQWEAENPELQIRVVRPIMPFCYLVSGGVSMRNLMPEILFPAWLAVEGLLRPFIRTWAMFGLIVVERR